jgi:hypothetical protein
MPTKNIRNQTIIQETKNLEAASIEYSLIRNFTYSVRTNMYLHNLL